MIVLRMLRRMVSVTFMTFGTFVLVIAIPDIVTGKQSAGVLLSAVALLGLPSLGIGWLLYRWNAPRRAMPSRPLETQEE